VLAKAEARRIDEERQAELANEMTVDAMLNLWLAKNGRLRTNDDDRALFRFDVTAPKGDASPLGGKRLSTVAKRDVARAIDRAVDRGSPVTATRLLKRLSTAFKWAASRGYIAANPCVGIQPPTNYKDRTRERVLSAEEIRAFLSVLPSSGLRLAHQRVLHLELLLGQRIGEICGMRKLELNMVDCLWSIPGVRTKNGSDHVCPLPPEARIIILAALADADRCRDCKGCRAGNGCDTPVKSPFVFPNHSREAPILANTVSHALERMQEPGDDGETVLALLHPQTGERSTFTSHDLRRTLATQVEKLGVPLRVISKLLNHTESKSITDAVYAHADLLPERYEALVRWQQALAGIMNGSDPFAFSVANFRDIEKRILGEPMKLIGTEVSR
jgi:integrase